jgi:pre-mRNA-splicing factor SYF2
MSTSQKRKGSPEAPTYEEPSKRRYVENEIADDAPSEPKDAPSASAEDQKQTTPSDEATGSTAGEDARRARFAALRARHSSSKVANLKASQNEVSRSTNETAALASLARKHAVASEKLLKAETEDGGEDFERKRAWDWTIEESERWDERVAEKAKRKGDQKFQSYRQDSRRTYERQMRNFAPDLEAYRKEKIEEVEKAVRAGELQLMEMEDGEIVAVTKQGKYFGGGAAFDQRKDRKEDVDRLVKDIQTAEAAKIKMHKDRIKGGEESGDVTYINADVSFLIIVALVTNYIPEQAI